MGIVHRNLTAERKRGPKLEPYQVLIRPVITEKGTELAESENAYTFQVHPLATKIEIKRAVEEMFKVTVTSVRTQNRKARRVRFRGRHGIRAAEKKAIVTLSENDRISLF